ncbi:hypothetical protein [Sulfurospirillum barnesii]|uniref:Uncharacterized protein n=1 Tax=Sulfurospirillum barnesii (strain ATCC 700032 / DSM 10660 / SES-3) TaxID=760154 RepID=I3Y0B7_SULBS|nr:hypothetical protein [Sulfurospirillum barnesii]AFL69641.1 hypothetical protein Sulba_2373 [Sulfurospirillum barnesii SES-3]
MTRSMLFLVTFFVSVGVCLAAQFVYLYATRTLSPKVLEKKTRFIAHVGLPDMSLVGEARYVRHRSLSDIFSIFGESPELLEYFPSTFVYHYAPYVSTSSGSVEP